MSAYLYVYNLNFIKTLTNNVVSFKQLALGVLLLLEALKRSLAWDFEQAKLCLTVVYSIETS